MPSPPPTEKRHHKVNSARRVGGREVVDDIDAMSVWLMHTWVAVIIGRAVLARVSMGLVALTDQG